MLRCLIACCESKCGHVTLAALNAKRSEGAVVVPNARSVSAGYLQPLDEYVEGAREESVGEICADEGRSFPRGVSAEADSDDSMTARASGVQRAPPRRDPRPQSSRPRGPRPGDADLASSVVVDGQLLATLDVARGADPNGIPRDFDVAVGRAGMVLQPEGPSVEEVVGDKGYHSNETLVDLKAVGLRTYISEPDRGRRCWTGRQAARDAVYANRRRIRGARGRRLLRCRGELLERPFAHLCETGGMRRVHLRGHPNILKRLLVHVAGCNLGLLLRHLTGVGTPRSLQGRAVARFFALIRRWCDLWGVLRRFSTPFGPTSPRTASSPRHQTVRPSL